MLFERNQLYFLILPWFFYRQLGGHVTTWHLSNILYMRYKGTCIFQNALKSKWPRAWHRIFYWDYVGQGGIITSDLAPRILEAAQVKKGDANYCGSYPTEWIDNFHRTRKWAKITVRHFSTNLWCLSLTLYVSLIFCITPLYFKIVMLFMFHSTTLSVQNGCVVYMCTASDHLYTNWARCFFRVLCCHV